MNDIFEGLPIREIIHQVVTTVLEVTFGVPLGAVGNAQSLERGKVHVGSTIQIQGDWSGTIAIFTTSQLAESLAQRLFHRANPEEDLIMDSLREFVNMVGGALKSQIDGQCSLTIPKSFHLDDCDSVVNGIREIDQTIFVVEQQPLVIKVYRE